MPKPPYVDIVTSYRGNANSDQISGIYVAVIKNEQIEKIFVEDEGGMGARPSA